MMLQWDCASLFWVICSEARSIHEWGESCAAAAAHVMALAALVGVGAHISALSLLHALRWLPTGWVV